MIPFVDLKAQYTSIKDEVNLAIQNVLESCQFVLGPEVAALEEEYAAYCGVKHAVAVNSGTSALHLALLAAGVGSGDEVITVPFTFVATAAAIYYSGARAVLVDVDPRYYNMDPSRVEAAISPRTKAILPVHLYGQPADMAPLAEIAQRRGLTLIEDAAQAHGAEYKGRRCGSFGDMGCFSFYPGKNLGAYGEGGIVVTDNAKYDRTLRMLRDWGAEVKYQHVIKGYNYRMEGIQGAVLRVKLRHIEDWTEVRRRHALLYDKLLGADGASPPPVMPDTRHVYHIYAIRTRERKKWIDVLHAQGIQTGIHYPYPVHLLPAYSDLGYKVGDFPNSEQAANEVLSLPMYPELTTAQCEQVAHAVGALVRDN
ncbi:MAG: DegT/DnrJ/EryC1/StrS family aminotransferase [Burkholderiaceae bacterium]